ncbi:MAG: HAMP domain-containing sensor histidine kinase, partial [Campylobacterota bacterium]|nr:HAMP domain-containing sensor histidine kinase [Campylobacterota bacterium]
TLKKLNLKLEKEVEAKTKDLKDINKTLEVRIKEEVQKNRKKDSLIHQQTKLASMGEMIGNIAHQWRQPLSVISTASSGMQLQKEYGLLTDELFQESCNTINTNSQFLSATIDDFQNYIKGDTKIVKFNLIDTINSFIKLISSSLKSYSIDIILEAEEKRELFGYPNQLNQCFVNIFNNAKDVLIQNNEASNRYIFITQKIIDNKIQIALQDNAGGIDENIMDKIFEPYFTTKHKSQGTGLGLHMTYSLVNSMGGTIEVQNIKFEHNGKNQKGALFNIIIPLQVKIG